MNNNQPNPLPLTSPVTEPDREKSSEPNTVSKLSDEAITEHLGFPTPEQQKTYDDTQRRVQQKRDRYYGTSAVQPIDPTKLSEAGIAHRKNVGAATAQLTETPAVSRLDAIMGRVATIRRRTRNQALPFDEAQQIVRSIYENDLANRERIPIWTPETTALVDNVTRYFIGDPTGPLPLSKGLYVYGPVGTSKTYLFRMMNILCEVVPIREMGFQMVSTKRILRAISMAKSLKPMTSVERGRWLIDDLGEEKRLTKIYNDVENPIDELIGSRYESYIDSGQLTHFTSNKQPDELEAIYGTRSYDRISEMVEAIFLDGESLRIDPIDEEL